MAGSYIELPKSELASIEDKRGTVTLELSLAYVIKSEGIPGVNESVRWKNSATFIFEDAEIEGDLPDFPAVIQGGDITVHGMTYRDMIALPMENVGYTELELNAGGKTFTITSPEHARVELPGPGRYVTHINKPTE